MPRAAAGEYAGELDCISAFSSRWNCLESLPTLECAEEENGSVSQRTIYLGCCSVGWLVGATDVEGPLRGLGFYDLDKGFETYFGYLDKTQTTGSECLGLAPSKDDCRVRPVRACHV